MTIKEIMELQKRLDQVPKNKGKFSVIYNTDVMLHQPQLEDHPETHLRAQVILLRIAERGKSEPWILVKAPSISWLALREVHDSDYLLALESAGHAGKPFFQSEDCSLGYDSLDGILAAAGCAVELAQRMSNGQSGFALTRPPGHHAGIRQAEGFCYLNHTALAVHEIRKKDPDSRILIVDIDVHHGNGIEEFFLDDPTTYYLSIHGSPEHLYPWTGQERVRGKGRGEGFTKNLTLPLGTAGETWVEAFLRGLAEVKSTFSPDYILVNAGFDAHEEDPYALMMVKDEHYYQVIDALVELAEKSAKSRIGLMLEGGYSLEVLGRLVPEIAARLSLKYNR